MVVMKVLPSCCCCEAGLCWSFELLLWLAFNPDKLRRALRCCSAFQMLLQGFYPLAAPILCPSMSKALNIYMQF